MTDKELRSGEATIVQKQADDALRESETRFRRISAITSDIAYSCRTEEDGHFSIDWITGAAGRITGYSSEEIKAQGCWRFLVVKEDIALFEENVIGLAPGSHGSCELRIRHKNGDVVWISSFAECVSEPQIPGRLLLYGGLADITGRKRAEQALSERNELFSLFMLHSPIYAYIKAVTPTESRVLQASDNYRQLLGISGLDMVGKTMAELFPAEFAAKITAEDWSVVSKRETLKLDQDLNGRNYTSIKFPIDQGDETLLGGYSIDITERKRAEDRLRVAQLQWGQFLETSPDPMWIKDASGRYVAANKTYYQMEPSVNGDIVGKTDAECFPPEKAAVYTADDRVAIEKGVSEGEFTAVDVDGKFHSFLTKRVVLRAPDGSVAGTLGLSRDITVRKQAEEETQRERAFFDRLVETAPEGIAITDPQGRIVRVNAEFVRMFGYDVDEAVGQDIDDLVAPPARQEEARAMTGSAGQGRGILLETVRRRKDGTLVDVSIIGAPILIAGKQEAVYAIYRDITERKQAEEALRESEENFRHSLDDSPLGVRIVTAEGKTIYANRAILDIYGFSSLEELRTTPVEKRYTSESYIEFKKRYEKRQQGEDSPSEYEVNVVRKNGEVRHLLVSRKGQLWNGKKQYQLLYRDITERKQAEAQLRQSQKMEAIGQLAGGVAHDFNNLLTGILGNIAIMRGSLPPADPLLENLTAAETSARQAADLTKGLLTFSRSAMVLPVPMNITAALDATLALLKQSLPATMDIVRDDEQTAWNVLVDQSQITQILLNLAVNARDAMEGRGTLTIRARNEVVGEEYLQAHPFARTGEFVHLSVTDTGPGMSSEVMQHLFEPFYTTKPIGSGTGLGLSVVYGAVKQAGGWITAVSAENVGVTFDIYLPRCLEKPAQSFTPSPPSANVRGGTVLVVEDEPVVRTVTQALLSRSGYTVLTAPDGASALNVLRDHPVGIGLILLDMTMPGMTTREIVQAIRALDPTVPILLNSGYTSNDIIKQMLEEGSVRGFLSKPYSLGELMGKVQELLHRG